MVSPKVGILYSTNLYSIYTHFLSFSVGIIQVSECTEHNVSVYVFPHLWIFLCCLSRRLPKKKYIYVLPFNIINAIYHYSRLHDHHVEVWWNLSVFSNVNPIIFSDGHNPLKITIFSRVTNSISQIYVFIWHFTALCQRWLLPSTSLHIHQPTSKATFGESHYSLCGAWENRSMYSTLMVTWNRDTSYILHLISSVQLTTEINPLL